MTIFFRIITVDMNVVVLFVLCRLLFGRSIPNARYVTYHQTAIRLMFIDCSFLIINYYNTVTHGDTRWRSWLRHCATSWKVAGSIPEGVVGIFH